MTRHRLAACLGALLVLIAATAPGTEARERRRDPFNTDFSYFVYPIASEVPGLGTATGVGATVTNMFDTKADFTGFKLQGDFDASGYVLLDMHLLDRLLILDAGVYDFTVGAPVYDRGIDSDPDDFLRAEVQGEYSTWQTTFSFNDRLFELYYRASQGRQRVLHVLDSDNNEFDNVDTAWDSVWNQGAGFTVDDTDDWLDPRVGWRLEGFRSFPDYTSDNPYLSEYQTTDFNLTGYIPFRQYDTLALNYFQSDAEITDPGVRDYDALEAAIGLDCEGLPTTGAQQECLATEREYIAQRQAQNRYGQATSLGGTQRLRSYPNGRFFAGHARFAGLEYRWNLTDVREPFDVWVAKGVHTGLQLAFFAEAGTVYDSPDDFNGLNRQSYGAGFRVLLSGVIVRADWANGDEGEEFQLFIYYPWSLFSVDSPS